jgi:hypothetical protein
LYAHQLRIAVSRAADVILQIREIEDPGSGGVYPLPSSDANGWLIRWEEQDGQTPMALNINGLEEYEILPGGNKLLTRLSKTQGVLYITDARIAVAVEKFTKGNKYWGVGAGAAVAVVAMGVSAARAAHKRHGKMLVGQVRYQWLKALAASPAQGRKGGSELRFVVDVKTTSGGTRTYRIDVTLGYPQVDPLLPAQDIIQRAARYRLSRYPGSAEHHPRLRELTQAPLLAPPAPGKAATYVMPNFFYMNNKTAYPPDPASGQPAQSPQPREITDLSQ